MKMRRLLIQFNQQIALKHVICWKILLHAIHAYVLKKKLLNIFMTSIFITCTLLFIYYTCILNEEVQKRFDYIRFSASLSP